MTTFNYRLLTSEDQVTEEMSTEYWFPVVVSVNKFAEEEDPELKRLTVFGYHFDPEEVNCESDLTALLIKEEGKTECKLLLNSELHKIVAFGLESHMKNYQITGHESPELRDMANSAMYLIAQQFERECA